MSRKIDENGNVIETQDEQSKYDLAMGYLNQYRDNQFKYDFNEDPVFQQAKDAYMKQGQLNAKNVAAQAAQLTGGYGNSYGTVAAQSVMNQAADNVNNIIPELQQAAYGRYQDEQNRNLNLANQYLTLHQQERDEAWEDEARERQRVEWAQSDEDREAANAWNKEQQERTRVEWGYADEDRERNIAYTEEDRAWSRAMQAASAGDYSLLKDLGINVDTAEKAAMFSLGMQYAEIGDFSILDALGVDSSYLKKLQEYQLAAAGNSGSGGTGTKYVYKTKDGDGDDDPEQEPEEEPEQEPEPEAESPYEIAKSALGSFGYRPKSHCNGGVLYSNPSGDSVLVKVDSQGNYYFLDTAGNPRKDIAERFTKYLK